MKLAAIGFRPDDDGREACGVVELDRDKVDV
jgi:hypothetical protein